MLSDTESESELQELLSNPGIYREIEKPKRLINNKVLLTDCLNKIKKSLPWVERLDVVTDPAPAPKESGFDNDVGKIDPNDDFRREALFYRVAQSAVLEAIPKLQALGIPTKRPNDYFAEMIKSDAHMAKVRENIVVNSKRLELREKARQLREQRKFGKQQQKEILEARRIEKKKHMEALKAAKKGRVGKEQAQVLEEYLTSGSKKQAAHENPQSKPNSKYYRPEQYANRRKVNQKRVFKNAVYGHGGQKKRSKRNNAMSFASRSKGEVSVLNHTSSAARINRLSKKMQKSKKKNVQKGRNKATGGF
nr:rRNA processing protein EBP2 [Hymenolepis microstoma]